MFVSEFVLGSSRCGRIFAASIATLEIGFSSTNKENWWSSNSLNRKLDFFLLRTMKLGFQLARFKKFFLILFLTQVLG